MALGVHRDERGVVYVEFLLAFFPLFLLFLGLCQLALIGAAEAIVRHSAYAAARTAIVVLEDDPERFDNAERRSLSQGRANHVKGFDDIMAKLGIVRTNTAPSNSATVDAAVDRIVSQHGARMVPIQAAAYLPLLPIAPSVGNVNNQTGSVSGALTTTDNNQLGYAAEYTKAATLVTVHDFRDSLALASEPVDSAAQITTRVTYLYHCTIPVVRAIVCSSLNTIKKNGLFAIAVAVKTSDMVGADSRFKLITATASLPNQGAGYLLPRAQ
jgi:Flp pilus assembly protein TadG